MIVAISDVTDLLEVAGPVLGLLIWFLILIAGLCWACLGPYLLYRLSRDAHDASVRHRELMRAVRDLAHPPAAH